METKITSHKWEVQVIDVLRVLNYRKSMQEIQRKLTLVDCIFFTKKEILNYVAQPKGLGVGYILS